MEIRNFKNMTERLYKYLSGINSSRVAVIDGMAGTAPEQYTFFDKYGWPLGRMEYNRVLRITCPYHNNSGRDLFVDSSLDRATEFKDNHTRILCLVRAVELIDNFYQQIELVTTRQLPDGSNLYHIDPDAKVLALSKLYAYQQTNLLPEDVNMLHKLGPAVPWRLAVCSFMNYCGIYTNPVISTYAGLASVNTNLSKIDECVNAMKNMLTTNMDGIKLISYIFSKDLFDIIEYMNEVLIKSLSPALYDSPEKLNKILKETFDEVKCYAEICM